MTTPAPSLVLVALTPEELAALRVLPELVAILRAGPLDTRTPTAAPATIPAEHVAAAAAVGSGNAADLVPHPLNPSAAPIPRKFALELLAAAPLPVKSLGEHVAAATAPVAAIPTLDELRAACGRAAARLGGNPAALARMATFGSKRVGDVPEGKRAAFVRYMDGDDAAKA